MISLSKEGKWILGVLLFLIVIAIVIPTGDDNAEVTLASEDRLFATEDAIKQNENIEIIGLEITDENIDVQNPFTYVHEKIEGKVGVVDEKVAIVPKPINNSAPIDAAIGKENPVSSWKLEGTVIGKNERTAVLSFGNQSKIVGVGDVFDDKTVTAIEVDYILYSSDKGEGRLTLSP